MRAPMVTYVGQLKFGALKALEKHEVVEEALEYALLAQIKWLTQERIAMLPAGDTVDFACGERGTGTSPTWSTRTDLSAHASAIYQIFSALQPRSHAARARGAAPRGPRAVGARQLEANYHPTCRQPSILHSPPQTPVWRPRCRMRYPQMRF